MNYAVSVAMRFAHTNEHKRLADGNTAVTGDR